MTFMACGRRAGSVPANWGPLVDVGLLRRAQSLRAARATNAGRPAAPRRSYALSMLHCAACGRRLIGDTNYYRHLDACPAFRAATPPWPAGWRGRHDGKGYPRVVYEALVAGVLERASLCADTIEQVVGLVTAPSAMPDRLALARMERERDAALASYRRDRDAANLERTMRRLDEEEAVARRPKAAARNGEPTGVARNPLTGLTTASLAVVWVPVDAPSPSPYHIGAFGN